MSDRPLFILGAGVDKCLGFPLMNDLMFELADKLSITQLRAILR